ncbi:hypothetical protein Tco_0324143 [Tanacetum coccineum]
MFRLKYFLISVTEICCVVMPPVDSRPVIELRLKQGTKCKAVTISIVLHSDDRDCSNEMLEPGRPIRKAWIGRRLGLRMEQPWVNASSFILQGSSREAIGTLVAEAMHRE